MAWNQESIKEIRSKLGLNKVGFAKLLAVDIRTVIRWENGSCRPTGPPEAILSALKEKLDKEPASLSSIRELVGSAVAVGGLAYLMVKLLDLVNIEKEGEGTW